MAEDRAVSDSSSPGCGARSRQLGGLPPKTHVIIWGAIFLLTLILWLASRHYQGRNAWDGWIESQVFRHPKYAEIVHADEFFRTRINTWSNFAYVVVGCYALAFGWQDWRRQRPDEGGYLVQTPAMSLLFGAACCYLGGGSGLFHASLTRWGQQLDVAAMYAPLVVLIAINTGRWMTRIKPNGRDAGTPSWSILAGLALAASWLLYRYKWSMHSSVVLPSLILTVAAFALLDRFKPCRQMAVRWLALSAVALAVAVVCRQLDVTGRFSNADAWLQGHALWHLLTSLSLASMYLYYHSETTSAQRASNSVRG